jgi:hypothetical protein
MGRFLAYLGVGVGLVSSHVALAQSLPFEGGMLSVGMAAHSASSRYVDDANTGASDGQNLLLGNHNLMTNVEAALTKHLDHQFALGIGTTYDLHSMDVGSNSRTSNSVPYRFSMRARNHWSLYLQPMYVLDDTTALFAKIGYHAAGLYATDLHGKLIGQDHFGQSFKLSGAGYNLGMRKSLPYKIFMQVEGQYVSFHERSSAAANAVDSRSYYAVKLNLISGIVSIGYQF